MRRLTSLAIALSLAGSPAIGSFAASLPQRDPPLGKLWPVDEFAREPGLLQLRDQVMAVVQSRDPSRLAAMSTDRLSIEDKEAMTRDQFLAWFRRMRAPQQAMFWQRLRDAMAQGFARVGDLPGPLTVEAPYVPALLARRPDIDRSLLAIAGAGIAVHRDPSGRSPVIDRLDHDVVYQGPALPEATPRGEYDGEYYWWQIKTPGGRLGWVLSKYALTTSEARFLFRKVDGVWTFAGYEPGD
jgi:hypothetical protein